MVDMPFEVLSPEQLRKRTSAKWSHYPPDVLPLWVAEMDVLPPDEVVGALTDAIRMGDTGYPPHDRRYAQAFAEFAAQRWGWAPDPGLTATCADVLSGIRALVHAVTEPGGRVVIPGPVYPPFWSLIDESGRRAIPVPLTGSGRLDLEAIVRALGDREGGATSGGAGDHGRPAILLCSPHNPTGVVHTAEELRAVAELADRWDATVIVDEIHAPLSHSGQAVVPWLSTCDRGFAVTSAAKAFNLPGLKAALIVAGPESSGVLRRLPESVVFGASHLGLIGHTAGLASGGPWLDAVNGNIAANVALLDDLLAEHLPGVRWTPPSATYLAWLDVRALGLGDDPARAFLERGRVALGRGPTFGAGGAGHVRVNVACSAAVLSEAVRRMAGCLT